MGEAATNGPKSLLALKTPQFSCGKGVTHTRLSQAAGLYFPVLFRIRNDYHACGGECQYFLAVRALLMVHLLLISESSMQIES